MSLHASVAVGLGEFEIDVGLDVADGEVLAVLGPNGSGKTSILRAIAGLLAIDRGTVTIDGRVFDDPSHDVFVPPEQRPVGLVFQDYLLFDHLSVLDNVAFGLRAGGTPKARARTLASSWLERVELSDRAHVRPRELSGGQAQRVALARSLVLDPRVLLLDEPLAALDVGTRRLVRRDLRRYLAGFDGMRILVTHDAVDAYALADRLAIVDDGRIVQTGTVAEITAHPRSRYVAELVGTNLIVGAVDHRGLTTADGHTVAVTGDVTGPAFAVIRPQSITLSLQPADSSARNTFEGTVDDIDQLGDRVRVGVAGPIHLTAEITVAALDTLGLRPGDRVYASTKATDVQTYPA